ncbi:MAG: type I secretion C-terminal target domain-containing protein [Rhodobacteraceae bacterium]|nr:type I secretion C-terminal target domain-containing protein [Paracoccaceae bacterium]
MTATTYIYDGGANLLILDLDGGIDFLQFDVTYNTWFPSEDAVQFFTSATWSGEDLSFGLATGATLTIEDQLGAGQIESLNLNPTAPFVYEFAGKVNGTGGSDWIVRETGGTSLGKGGDDLMFGSAQSDILRGGGGFDILLGFDGDDQLIGGSGRLSADGGSGNDKIIGGSDYDYLFGGTGDDTLNGKGGRDQVIGGDGADILRGGSDNDVLYGGDGADKLYGEADDDWLVGGFGADRLKGGDGNDVMSGGEGVDRLKGGAGFDSFIFEDVVAFQGVDILQDFSANGGDLIDIRALTTQYDQNVNDVADFVSITDNGAHSFLEVDQAGTGAAYQRIAKINNTVGLDLQQLIADGDLLV